MTMHDLFTIVVHESDGPKAVVPFDSNPGCESDEGMLVYLSSLAAGHSAMHQNELYDLGCKPMRLVDYIGAIQGCEDAPSSDSK